MENSSNNGKKEKSTSTIDQTQQSTTSEPKTQSERSKQGVFLMRAKGHNWEEFVEACIKSCGEAGLLSDYKPKK